MIEPAVFRNARYDTRLALLVEQIGELHTALRNFGMALAHLSMMVAAQQQQMETLPGEQEVMPHRRPH